MESQSGDEPSSSSSSSSEVASSSLDLGQIEDYLNKVCPVLLDAEPASFDSALKSPAAQERLKKFVSDAKVPTLLVRKKISENAEEDVGGKLQISL